MGKHKKWTESEILQIKSLYKEGKNFVEIGEAIGRRPSTIRVKLVDLGVHKVESNKTYLYDIKHLRKYIINVDEAKTLTHGSQKKIKVKCDNCDKEKMTTPNHLIQKGLICPNCSEGSRKLTQDKVNKMIEMYEDGMTFAQIGKEVGMTRQSVGQRFRSMGYKPNKSPHVYSIGEVVNDSMKIVERLRKTEDNSRHYRVQSLEFPNWKSYIMSENSLKDGVTCKHSNSLYGVESVRGNIIDIDEAKKVTSGSGKKILFKCSTDGCDNQKLMYVHKLVNQGYSCPNCSKGISYSELFFTAYLQVKNIPFETQVIYEELGLRRYDFKIQLNGISFLVETHGLQHFLTEDKTYYKVKSIQESDSIKRNYAKNNNINLIELDCRESSFEFIRQQIEDNKYLPNIEGNDIPKMIELMEINSRYPVKKIIKMYESGKSTIQIGEKLGVNYMTICNIFKRNNIKLRDGGSPKRMVRQIETGRLFNSGLEAHRQTGISQSNISENCNGKRKTAGKHHITSDKLHWETVSPKQQQAINKAQSKASNHTDKDIDLSTDGLSDSFLSLLDKDKVI